MIFDAGYVHLHDIVHHAVTGCSGRTIYVLHHKSLIAERMDILDGSHTIVADFAAGVDTNVTVRDVSARHIWSQASMTVHNTHLWFYAGVTYGRVLLNNINLELTNSNAAMRTFYVKAASRQDIIDCSL